MTALFFNCSAKVRCKIQMQILRLAALAQDDSIVFQLLSESALQMQMQVLRLAALAQDDSFLVNELLETGH
jgi:hypothetical protein